MGTVYIYALCEPDLWKEIRYIGVTCSLQYRIMRHLAPYSLRGDSERARWLKRLQSDGLKPAVLILETLPNINLWDAMPIEEAWIKRYHAQGARLTNIIHNKRPNQEQDG